MLRTPPAATAKPSPSDTCRTISERQLQESGFYEHLTLAEQLRFLGACYGTRPDANAVLADVDLADRPNWFIKQLSGGQQQRFALAAALVNDPPLVLLDEPSTGLDPAARQQLWVLIRKLRDRGHTIVLSTHYMEEAEALCDRVAIVDKGQIAAIDTPNRLIDQLLATPTTRSRASTASPRHSPSPSSSRSSCCSSSTPSTSPSPCPTARNDPTSTAFCRALSPSRA